MEKALQAVIFDLDGTLAETERHGHRVAYNGAFRALGLPWHWSVASYGGLLQVAGGRERLRHFMATYPADGPHPPPPAAQREALIEAIMKRKGELLAARIAAGELRPRPGVLRLLDELADAGVAVALATTAARDSADRLLPALLGAERAARFHVRIAGEDAAAKKPAPEAYTRCLEALGVPGRHCVAVEDSRNGLLAARAAGLPVVVTPSEYTRGEDFSEAQLVVDGLGGTGRPCRVLRGALPGGSGVVGLAALRLLVAQAVPLS